MVREFLKEDDRKCCFIFDSAFQGFGDQDHFAFEQAVRACANLLRHFHELGCETRLATPQGSTRYSKNEDGLTESLKLLAVIQPDEAGATALAVLAEDSAFKIVFTASRRGEVPATVWSDSHADFLAVASVHGTAKMPSLTPLEYAATFQSAELRWLAEEITGIYNLVRFGSKPVAEEQIQRAYELVKEIRLRSKTIKVIG